MKLLPHSTSAGMIFGCLLAALVPGCERASEDLAWWELEQERVRLSQRLELLRYRLDQAGPRPDPAMVAVVGERAELARESAARLRDLKEELAGEVAALEGDLKSARLADVRKRREQATGRLAETFHAKGGRVYRQATIMSIDDAGISLRHRDGAAWLKFSDLTPEQQQLFGLDETTAKVAEEAELESARRYERWIDETMVGVREERQRQAEVAKVAAEAEARRGVVAASFVARAPAKEHRSRLNGDRSVSRPVSARVRVPRQRSTFYYTYPRIIRPGPCVVRPVFISPKPARIYQPPGCVAVP